MKTIKKVLLNGLFVLVALSGVTQCFIITGVFWNMTFPILPIIMLVLGLKRLHKSNWIKYCTILIFLLTLVEVGFAVYSHLNIHRKNLDTELSIMSYNLFFKNGNKNHSTEIMNRVKPDILVVQELTPSWATKLEKSLDTAYKYQRIKPMNGTHGMGIYSKYPLQNERILGNASNLPFAQVVDVNIRKKKIQIINTHLASPAIAVENPEHFFKHYINNYRLRKDQIIRLNKLAAKSMSKLHGQFLAGDLNTLYAEPLFKMLKLKWVNAYCALDRWTKFNFPHSSKICPIMTLDYIMGRGSLKFLNTKVIKGGSSDHLPVLTRVKL